MSEEIGLRLKIARKKKELKQYEAGKMANVTAYTLSSYERGRRQPDLMTLTSLCKVYECSTDYILTGVKNKYSLDMTPEEMRDNYFHLEIKLYGDNLSKKLNKIRKLYLAGIKNIKIIGNI
jgi:transcriptional regulator with XRE-family HTH domain